MIKSEIFQYSFRKAYGSSDSMLIEFSKFKNLKRLIGEILKILEQLNFKKGKVEDIWINDEVLINLYSDDGEVIISIGNYGFVFIMPKDERNDVINKIEREINKSSKFQKIRK